MRHPKYTRSFEVVAELPDSLRPLERIATNFRWTWSHTTRDLFRSIDKRLWEEVGHNPVQMIRRLTPADLERLAADEVLLAKMRVVAEDLERYLTQPTWFDAHLRSSDPDLCIAYFCAEFGVSEAMPIYSGGLGVLAGDHLKAASDLGIPLVGVGLLYSRGYFRQRLNPSGWQEEHYPNIDFYQLPLTLQRGDDGQPIRVRVDLPDRVITCQVWRADVGRVPLYLLDSNVMDNAPDDKTITDTLYGGDEELRLRQELILGIGGMKALQALGVQPTVCHMNEGHAAFLSVERIRQYMERNGCSYAVARQATRQGNVFTTHTPVPAGFDLFNQDLVHRYFSGVAESLGIPFDEFADLGRLGPAGDPRFNMAVLAMNNANRINGVSELHAKVSRALFKGRWPEIPEDEVPIDPVTNGIHTPTWVGRRMAELLERHLGSEWAQATSPDVWKRVSTIPDEELWAVRERQRADLVRFVRNRHEQDVVRRGGQVPTDQILDPRLLTIGFARRFATYKRATLLLADRARLKRLLFHAERGVQIVIAGKSHPRDDGGKSFIQQLFQFIESEGAQSRVVFVEDYDMAVARQLVQGVDVWLNNPRRPMEASGTSGMKVVPNGGLNLSILDGWWDEGYSPSVGWAIGDRTQVGDEAHQDWLDSVRLYQILEEQIVPRFYQRLNGDPPRAWVEMIRSSMTELSHRFSTVRMVEDYVAKAYLPAHRAFKGLSGDLHRAEAAWLWKERVESAWGGVKVLSVEDDLKGVNPLGGSFQVRATVDLGSLRPEDVVVEALVGRVGPNQELGSSQVQDLGAPTGSGPFHYSATVGLNVAGHWGYALRVRPRHADVRVETELPVAVWS